MRGSPSPLANAWSRKGGLRLRKIFVDSRSVALLCCVLLVLYFSQGTLWGLVVAPVAAAILSRLLKSFDPAWPEYPPRFQSGTMIFLASFLTLFYELVIIRYQASHLPVFGYYKNVSLLACFLGLGLGYSNVDGRCRLVFVSICTAVQAPLLLAARFWMPPLGNPTVEQIAFGLNKMATLQDVIYVYSFLGLFFVLSALACYPLGQFAGFAMARQDPLLAYSKNLVGSLAGILVFTALSYLESSPITWFAVSTGLLMVFAWPWPKQTIAIAVLGLAMMVVEAADLDVLAGHKRIHSPYQLLVAQVNPPGSVVALWLKVNHDYYQRIFDFRSGKAPESENVSIHYYDAPYRVISIKPARVLILGSGTGNDVAAAVRGGAGEIDAVEIDPAIARLGKIYHPERPYERPNVHLHLTDSRQFLKRAQPGYDLILYGLLDSHTSTGNLGNVRLDSFVYTLEGLREARALLAPNGFLVLTFTLTSAEHGEKIFSMLRQAFAGQPPRSFATSYDSGTMFVAGTGVASLKLAPETTAVYAQPGPETAPSTDDWPFFYFLRRAVPFSYLTLLGWLLVLTAMLIPALSKGARFTFQPEFFCLGGGFMLLETRGMTELGVAFGNTWILIPIVVSAILTFGFLANWLALARQLPTAPCYGALFLLLAAEALFGLSKHLAGLLAPDWQGLARLVLLLVPLFFAALIFSLTLKQRGNIQDCMASNLFGAMLGGCLEYFSLYTGYHALTYIAIALYLGAFASRKLIKSQ